MSCHKHSKPNIQKQPCELYDQCLPLEELGIHFLLPFRPYQIKVYKNFTLAQQEWKHKNVFAKGLNEPYLTPIIFQWVTLSNQKSFNCCKLKYNSIKEPYVPNL
jgi:hypothetical protein